MNSEISSFYTHAKSFEVAVIEDNKLINMILSKALDSTIGRIRDLKKIPVKFSSFRGGTEFLSYLKKKDFGETKLIIFSDYYLEEKINGSEILQYVNQNEIDATVIIMSDTTNKQTSVDTVEMGAHSFLPKNNRTPNVCSEIVTQMVI